MVREKRERVLEVNQSAYDAERWILNPATQIKTTAKVSFQSDLHPLSRRLLTH